MTTRAYHTTKIFFALGTVCTLTVFGGASHLTMERAKARVLEIAAKLNKDSRPEQIAMSKGYAAQEVKRIFRADGVTEALIELGDTIVNMGSARRIGIQNPFGKAGENFAYIDVENKAVVTSGMYIQGFPENPKDGDGALAGLTLIGDNAVQLSALCNAASRKSAKDALAFLNDTEVEAIFVTRGQDVLSTDGLTKRASERDRNSAEKAA